MFIPQLDEVDTFDAGGQQQDDINSVVEFVDQSLLGNRDDTPEDEDDDSGQNFQLITVDYFYDPASITIDQSFASIVSQEFFDRANNRIPAVSLEIITPPPKGKYFI